MELDDITGKVSFRFLFDLPIIAWDHEVGFSRKLDNGLILQNKTMPGRLAPSVYRSTR